MFLRFGNKDDGRCYQSAEDAFTSEGGHVTWEPEVLEKDADNSTDHRQPPRAFAKMMARYLAAMFAMW